MRSSLLTLVGVAAPLAAASAVRPRYRPAANAVAAAAEPLITTAPIIPQKLLHRQAAAAPAFPSCARACIDKALTDDTTCTASDYSCGCQYTNAFAIQSDAWSSLEQMCLTYITEAFTVAYTVPTVPGVVVTTTVGGRVTTTVVALVTPTTTTGNLDTATVTVGSGSSGSGSDSGSGSGSGSDSGSGSSAGSSSGSSSSSSSSKESHSLSKGAIVGIAVGAAGGAIIVCAILFLIYRCTKRNNSKSAALGAASGPEKPSEAGSGAAAIPPTPSPVNGGPPGNAADVSPISAVAVPATGAAAAAAATTAVTVPDPVPSSAPAYGSELDGKPTTTTTNPSVSPAGVQPAMAPNTLPQLYDQNGVPLDAATSAAIWQQQQLYAQQQYAAQYAAAQQQQPYIVQGYSIAPGQAPQLQSVAAPAGYAAAHPSLPLPGVIYQEAPADLPQSHYPQELSTVPVGSDVAAFPDTHYSSAVPPPAVGPSAALPVASSPAPVDTTTPTSPRPAADTALSPSTPQIAPVELLSHNKVTPPSAQ
ncbi:MAG: hypothetical protein STHCBS139747_003155 [Sporothrix thermara]